MNSEIYFMSRLVAAAKRKLMQEEYKTIFSNEPDYVKKIEIQFLQGEKYNSWESFLDELFKKGIDDIELYLPTKADNRMNLGFTNSSSVCIRVYYKDGNITGFLSDWTYDELLGGWKILYSEHNLTRLKMKEIKSKQSYENNELEIISILEKISRFASEIGADEFTKIFDETYRYIKSDRSDEGLTDEELKKYIPQKNFKMYEAANMADVFGAMGSWNDEPAYLAFIKKRKQEYEELSDELLKQIRLALLYAINEW